MFYMRILRCFITSKYIKIPQDQSAPTNVPASQCWEPFRVARPEEVPSSKGSEFGAPLSRIRLRSVCVSLEATSKSKLVARDCMNYLNLSQNLRSLEKHPNIPFLERPLRNVRVFFQKNKTRPVLASLVSMASAASSHLQKMASNSEKNEHLQKSEKI